MGLKDRWARWLYALLFCVVVPILLILWAAAAENSIKLPSYGTPEIAAAILIVGGTLIASAMLFLWLQGGGLPMNAFPPPRYVGTGPYRIMPHPIYVGFTLLCLGVSMAERSRSGLWLVTPAVGLGCAALVLGYEAGDLRRRFRSSQFSSWLPEDTETAPAMIDRARFLLFTVVPWLALYAIMAAAGVPADAVDIRLPFERRIPVIEWTEVIYASPYIAVPLAGAMARSRSTLRKLMIRSWLAMAVAFPLYLALPVIVPRPPFNPTTALGRLLQWERGLDPPVAAFPSFHVIWAILCAETFADRGRFALNAARIWAAAVSVACWTTGMHSLADILSGCVLAWMALASERIWRWLRMAVEKIANSWREWRLGPVRFINHGLYGGIAGGSAILIVAFLVGPGHTIAIVVTGAAAIAGAALWAQWIEGSSRLLRPFGFYGGMFGVVIAAGIGALAGWDFWLLTAAYCMAAPVMQSIGRLRCLVQGCCHGRAASSWVGIQYTRPESRVVRIAHLNGVPVHPTPLYSIIWNGLVFVVLARLWAAGVPLHFVAGIYAILTGLGRFVEEEYRGEPQTPYIAGLRLYQWVAIGTVVVGAAVTALGSSDRPPSPSLNAQGVVLAFVFGLISACALGLDFPNSNRTLARLT